MHVNVYVYYVCMYVCICMCMYTWTHSDTQLLQHKKRIFFIYIYIYIYQILGGGRVSGAPFRSDTAYILSHLPVYLTHSVKFVFSIICMLSIQGLRTDLRRLEIFLQISDRILLGNVAR